MWGWIPPCGLPRPSTKSTKIRSMRLLRSCAAWCYQACLAARAARDFTNTTNKRTEGMGVATPIPSVLLLVVLIGADGAWRDGFAGSHVAAALGDKVLWRWANLVVMIRTAGVGVHTREVGTIVVVARFRRRKRAAREQRYAAHARYTVFGHLLVEIVRNGIQFSASKLAIADSKANNTLFADIANQAMGHIE